VFTRFELAAPRARPGEAGAGGARRYPAFSFEKPFSTSACIRPEAGTGSRDGAIVRLVRAACREKLGLTVVMTAHERSRGIKRAVGGERKGIVGETTRKGLLEDQACGLFALRSRRTRSVGLKRTATILARWLALGILRIKREITISYGSEREVAERIATRT